MRMQLSDTEDFRLCEDEKETSIHLAKNTLVRRSVRGHNRSQGLLIYIDFYRVAPFLYFELGDPFSNQSQYHTRNKSD